MPSTTQFSFCLFCEGCREYSLLAFLSPHQILEKFCNIFVKCITAMSSPRDHEIAGYTLHSYISITSMSVEHLNNMLSVLSGCCKGFGAQNRSTEIPLPSPECYCNCKVTDDSFHVLSLAVAELGGSNLNVLRAKLCVSPFPVEQSYHIPMTASSANVLYKWKWGRRRGKKHKIDAVSMQTCPRGNILTTYWAWWVYHRLVDVLNACLADRLKFSYAEQWTMD